MRGFIITIIALIISFQYAFADGFQDTYSEALECFNAHKYNEAEDLFKSCLSDPKVSMNSDIQRRINDEIKLCQNRIEERERNARAVMQKERDKREQRKKNRYVYLSVNTESTGDLYDKTTSAMSEVMRLNNRSFCPNIDDALTVVTVFIKINPDTNANGFFKATGGGFVRLGSAIDEKDFVGQWSVESEATSAVNMNDASRLLQNKLNYQLSYALDNLLNNRPQGVDYIIPKNSISVYFADDNDFPETNLSFLREAVYKYISMTPDMILSSALDEVRNNERDKIAKLQAQNVKMEGRFPVHELEGFSQVLRLSVKKDFNGKLVFGGEISETIPGKMGNTLTNVSFIGADFDITDLSAENQTTAAQLLAVRLGFHHWEAGEVIGKYKIALVDGVNCTLIQKYAFKDNGPWAISKTTYALLDIGKIHSNMINYDRIKPEDAERWRFPTIEELEDIRIVRKKIGGLDGKYWSCSPGVKRGTHQVLDFLTGIKTEEKDNNKNVAAWLLVKEL